MCVWGGLYLDILPICHNVLSMVLIAESWNVLAALDGKHVAMMKPKKSRSEFYNYKGYFCQVLLALVDAEYRFLWVDLGSSGSSSDVKYLTKVS